MEITTGMLTILTVIASAFVQVGMFVYKFARLETKVEGNTHRLNRVEKHIDADK
jgi:hypothetical protein